MVVKFNYKTLTSVDMLVVPMLKDCISEIEKSLN